MALPAEKLDPTARQVPIKTKPGTATEATMPVLEVVHGLEVTVGQQPEISPLPKNLETDVTDRGVRRRRSRLEISAKEAIDGFYRKTRQGMTDVFNGFTCASRDLTKRLGRRARNLKEERPLRVLAVIGATALALGAAVRYWREGNHARR